MQIRHLEYFLAVANDGSFTAASERLHVVQSGVSAAIRSLERELGVPLFVRTPRGVQLSDAGTTLLPYAHAALAQVREGAEAVQEVRRGVRGSVVAGVLPVLGLLDLPPVVADYHRQYPNVAVRLTYAGTRTLADRLAAGDIDFALLSPVGPLAPDISLTRVGVEPFVALVPADHELAAREHVTLADLADHPFVDSPPGFGNRDLLDHVLTQHGLRRRITIELPDAMAIPRLVQGGAGVALVPRFVAADHLPGVRVLGTVDAPQWSLFLATADHHPPSRAARLLIRAIAGSRPREGATEGHAATAAQG